MSEEFSVGYDEGYQDGWNDAIDESAPVRTKDLTDDEIESVYNEYLSNLELYLSNIKFARAVIAADREKNK